MKEKINYYQISIITIPVLLLPLSLHSFTWYKECIDTVRGSGAYGTDIEVDSLGYPHVIYRQIYDKGLMYARWNGSQWLYEDVSESLSVKEKGTAGELSLELDSLGYPRISQPGPGYTWKDGIGWHRVYPDPGAHSMDWTSLRLDSEGRPHIAYNDHYEIGADVYDGVRYCFYDGSQWYVNVVVSPDPDIVWVGQAGISLALDNLNLPHIIYSADDDTNQFEFKVAYAYKDTFNTWHKEYYDTSGSKYAHYPNLELDSLDRPVVAYGFGAGYTYLRLAEKDSTGWNYEWVDTSGYTGLFIGLTLDSLDNKYIAYWADNCLKFTCDTGIEWQEEKIDSVTSGDRLRTSYGMTIDRNGYLHISYSRSLGGMDNNRMWYATTNPETGIKDDISNKSLSFEVPSIVSGESLNIKINTEKEIKLYLYDITGRKVKEIYRGAGNYSIIDVSELSGGIYFLRIKAGDKEATQKLLMIR